MEKTWSKPSIYFMFHPFPQPPLASCICCTFCMCCRSKWKGWCGDQEAGSMLAAVGPQKAPVCVASGFSSVCVFKMEPRWNGWGKKKASTMYRGCTARVEVELYELFHYSPFYFFLPSQVQVGSTPQDQRIVGYISCTHLQAIAGTVRNWIASLFTIPRPVVVFLCKG